MNIYGFLPIKILITAAYGLITTLSNVLAPVAGGQSAAFAIVLLTVAVRALLIPVGRSQVKAGIARRRLAPKIAELRRRHQKRPEVLQRKLMELYSKENASPIAGCLPLLAQMPVLMAVYGLFILPTIDGHPNELLSHAFLGVPMDTGLVGQIGASSLTWTSGAVFVTITVVIAAVAHGSRRLLTPSATPDEAPRQPGVPDLSGLTRVLSFMPFMTAIVAVFVPLAAALYLMTTTAWTLGERMILNRVLGTRDAIATSPDSGH